MINIFSMASNYNITFDGNSNSELNVIVLTSLLTIAGGIIIFIFSEIIKLLVIIPLQKYHEQVLIVNSTIDFWSKYLCNHFPSTPSKKQLNIIEKMTDEVRKSAVDLNSKYMSISFCRIFVFLNVIPNTENIKKAYGNLIYLHNSVLYENDVDEHNNTRINREMINSIKNCLKIPK